MELLNTLVDRLEMNETPWLATHFSKRLASYTQDASGVHLHFTDDTTARADILIGADGVNSAARRTMYTHLATQVRATDPGKACSLAACIAPSWSGTYAYRTLLDRKKLATISPSNPMLGGGVSVSMHACLY